MDVVIDRMEWQAGSLRHAGAGPGMPILPVLGVFAARFCSADLVDRGLVLAGGGALLRGFDKLLSEETGLPVHVAEDPLSAVAEGTGKCLNELKFLRQVASADRQWR